jgi:hypothetical protein
MLTPKGVRSLSTGRLVSEGHCKYIGTSFNVVNTILSKVITSSLSPSVCASSHPQIATPVILRLTLSSITSGLCWSANIACGSSRER